MIAWLCDILSQIGRVVEASVRRATVRRWD